MDLEVFLNKNQLLKGLNEKISETLHPILKRILVHDLLSVQEISNAAHLVIKVKWSFLLLPMVKRIANIKMNLEEGDISGAAEAEGLFIRICTTGEAPIDPPEETTIDGVVTCGSRILFGWFR